LTKKDKAVFWYREKRRAAWKAVASETMLNEAEWNDRYDQEELEKVRVSVEELETMLEEDQQKTIFGYGPAGQGRK
jgi:tripartite-type tricarboxylate transporter receptor subunit TctC